MASQVSKWTCHKIECLADFIQKVSAGTKDGGCYVELFAGPGHYACREAACTSFEGIEPRVLKINNRFSRCIFIARDEADLQISGRDYQTAGHREYRAHHHGQLRARSGDAAGIRPDTPLHHQPGAHRPAGLCGAALVGHQESWRSTGWTGRGTRWTCWCSSRWRWRCCAT